MCKHGSGGVIFRSADWSLLCSASGVHTAVLNHLPSLVIVPGSSSSVVLLPSCLLSFCPPPFCEVGGDQCEPLWVRLLAFALGSTKREPQQALEGRRKVRGSGQGSFGDPVKAQGPWDRPFTRCHLSLPSLPSAPSPPLPVLTLSELSPTLDSMHSSLSSPFPQVTHPPTLVLSTFTPVR